MADRKITELSAMSAGGQATGDLLTIVDVSEAAAADKNKKMTMENLFKGIPGDVGIGTASPSHLLDLSNSSNAYIRQTRGSSAFRVGPAGDQASDGVILGTDTNGPLRIFTNGSSNERMRIDSSGNVGIGTSSPTTKLNVEYGALEAASLHELILNANYGTTNNGGGRIGITFSGHPDGSTGAGSKTAGVYGVSTDNTAFTRSMGLVFNTSTTDANSAERMRLTSDGKLGIGDNSPGHKLVVKDAGATNTSNYLNVISGNAANAGIAFGDTDSDLVGGILYNHSDNALRFFKSGFTEAARIDSSGRLYVGTSSGQSASGHTPSLQVSGTDFSTATVSITNNANSSNGSYLFFCKQRSGSPGGTTVLQSGDLIGQLRYVGGDGSDMNSLAATIDVKVDGTPGSNDMPGRIEFATTSDGSSSPTERARITSSGNFLVGTNSNTEYSLGKGSLNVGVSSTLGNQHAVKAYVANTSFSETGGGIKFTGCRRSASSAYSFGGWYSGNGSTAVASDKEFNLRGDGNAFADGSWSGGGADYAEYFEWSDGNTSDEDRRGISVVLDGDKIREAVANEEPIGVVSGNPSVIGDADIDRWKGKYLRDDFGTELRETHNVVKWTETITDEDGNESIKEHNYEDWNLPEGIVVPDDAVVSAVDDNGKPFTHRILNPDYNPDTAYISREDRPEWATVGLMGKLRVRKGQITGARWIKMRDVSDTVEEWLVR